MEENLFAGEAVECSLATGSAEVIVSASLSEGIGTVKYISLSDVPGREVDPNSFLHVSRGRDFVRFAALEIIQKNIY